MTIQWRDSSSTVTDSIEEPLDLESLIQIPADFQVMQVQLETLDESLEEPTIPKAYKVLANIFSPSNANFLPPNRDEDDAIELEPGKTPLFGPLYNLSEYQLKTLREYIDENLANRFIWPSKSSVGAPVLFTPKQNGTLRLCVNYRGLNSMTMKNWYPLPLIDEILDRFSGARVFTKIDVKNAYYRFRIRENDEWETAFRTLYGLFEYLVMPFELTNAPASFQSYINGVLRPYLDITIIVYLDYVRVFSRNLSQHEKHIREVLKALLKAGLYAKLSKCLFSVTWSRWNGRKSHLYNLQLARARICLWGPKFSWICQLLPLIGQRVFQNSTPAHGYDQKSSKEKKERSSLAEERFFDAGGLQIFSRVGSYFHILAVPCSILCKSSNMVRNRCFRLCNLWNFIAKTRNRVERHGLLLTQNDRCPKKLRDPWCWTSCYCWEFPSLASLSRATVSHCESTHWS